MKLISDLTLEEILSICDHTYLNRPEAFYGKVDDPVRAWREEFDSFLRDTVELPFAPYAVCVRHDNVEYVKDFLGGDRDDIKIAATAGFPYGACSFNTKKGEVLIALDDGADEVDFVMDYMALKEMGAPCVYEDVGELNEVIHNHGALSKLILETSELNIEQIKLACCIAEDVGVDFVKTSSGYTSKFASVGPLRIMRKYFSRGVKMSGKVKKENVYDLLGAVSGRSDGMIDLDPMRVRIGESGLIGSLRG